MLAIPGLLFAIGIAAMLGQSLQSVMIAIAVVNIPIFARLLRGQMLESARGRLRVGGHVGRACAAGSIVFRHILPNSVSPVIVQGTLTLATAIIEAAGLAFLGLGGTDPSVPEWGRMLADSQNYLAERHPPGDLPRPRDRVRRARLHAARRAAPRGPRPEVPAMSDVAGRPAGQAGAAARGRGPRGRVPPTGSARRPRGRRRVVLRRRR